MRNAVTILSLVLLVAGVGCSSQDDAMVAAEGFWDALADHDIEKARTFATKDSASSLNMSDDSEDQDVAVEFGEVEATDNETRIATSMKTSGPDGDEMTMAMQTIVVREDGEWKVDVTETFMSMFGGAMEQMMQELGNAMGDAMGEAFEGMGEAMESGSANVMEEMSRALEQVGSGEEQ